MCYVGYPGGYCTVPVLTAAVPDCGYCRWVLCGTAGTAGTVQYPQYPWVLQGTVGTVGTARAKVTVGYGRRQYPWVLQGTVGTVGTVTVGYCGYCRWVLQGTVERIECSGRECYTQH